MVCIGLLDWKSEDTSSRPATGAVGEKDEAGQEVVIEL